MVHLYFLDSFTFSKLLYNFKKLNFSFNFMAPFYEWGSTASRPEPLRGGSLLFTTKFPELLLLILSTSERWKAESSLELSHPWSHPVVSNTEPLDWEYSTLTSRSCSIKPLALSCVMWKNGQAYLNKLAVFTPQNF